MGRPIPSTVAGREAGTVVGGRWIFFDYSMAGTVDGGEAGTVDGGWWGGRWNFFDYY